MPKRNGQLVPFTGRTAPEHLENENPWHLTMGYDYRFGNITFQVGQDGNERTLAFLVPLAEMLKKLNIQPHELAALLKPEYAWTEGMADIDGARIRLLESVDWKGKVVLDIGGYDGFAAEIAHKGGAARAICLDNHQYEHYGWEEIKKPGVEYVAGDVMAFSLTLARPDTDEEDCIDHSRGDICLDRPDVLINYNVVYHVKNPWAFLDKCREIIKPEGEMLLCTLFRYHDGPWMYVYEPRECNPSDETVYFGPSLGALERLLKATGWDATQYALAYDRVLYRCKPTAGWQRKHEDT